MHIDCINRFEPLSEQTDSSYRDEFIDSLHVDVSLVECKVKALERNKRERKLRVVTLHGIFQGWVVSINRRKLKSC